MKIIFLDIDGVLNWAGTDDRYCGFVGLCQERISRFNKIIDAHPDAKIVISSTWRHSFTADGYKDFQGLVDLLKTRGLRGDIIDKTPSRWSYVPRGGEIREWIEDWESAHPDERLTFVILDDDTSGMEEFASEFFRYGDDGEDEYVTVTGRDLRPYQVVTFWDGEQRLGKGYNEILTDIEGGLQDYHIEQAIRVLNGEPIRSDKQETGK